MKVEKASRDGSERENLFKKALRGLIMVGEFLQKKMRILRVYCCSKSADKARNRKHIRDVKMLQGYAFPS